MERKKEPAKNSSERKVYTNPRRDRRAKAIPAASPWFL
jgi:hypothetical protein